MNYSYIPQKFIEYRPVYSNNYICPNCGSNSIPLASIAGSLKYMDMVGSARYCTKCKNKFNPPISRYEKVVVEK